MKRINALTIAGTDPSGGAGIQADLKTFSALGAYGTSVITALVAQNTCGVQSVYRITPDFVAAQLDSVLSDVRIDSAKIGMLSETAIVEQVSARLSNAAIPFVVLDTVMVAKSGDALLSPDAVASVRELLLPQVSLITHSAEQRFSTPRVNTRHTHGTGCTLSAALAALRPRHADWAETIGEAKNWLQQALLQADSLEVGKGIGPVHHFHQWW